MGAERRRGQTWGKGTEDGSETQFNFNFVKMKQSLICFILTKWRAVLGQNKAHH